MRAPRAPCLHSRGAPHLPRGYLSQAPAPVSRGHMAAGLLPRGVGLFAPCPRPWLSSCSAPLPVKLCLEVQSDFTLSLVRPGAPVGLVTHLASFWVSTALTERDQKSFPQSPKFLLCNQCFLPLFAVGVGEMLPRASQVVLVLKNPPANAAAAAKSLQSCPTLCDPIDSSPPGSPVPGILQARTLEWVAISFSDA